MGVYDKPNRLEDLISMILDRPVPWFAAPRITGRPNLEINLNLGAGKKRILGVTALDLPQWDADTMPIPFQDGEVDNIYAFHFLEHVNDPRAVLRECQRVLKVGGRMYIGVPHYSSQIAFHDLDHKHFFTEETWKNMLDQTYYTKGHEGWKLAIINNLIVGLVERNLMVVTVMERMPENVL